MGCFFIVLIPSPVYTMRCFWTQKSGCEGLERNGQARVVTPEATYALVYAHNAFASPETCT